MTDTMYPSYAVKVKNENFLSMPHTTNYGFVLNGYVDFKNGQVAQKNQYFCIWTKNKETFTVSGEAIFMCRIGYKGQNCIGGPLEEQGRLSYIDGCSDSLLVYPPRQGDPSLSALYFPPGIDQTYHSHPSIRLGVVVQGRGYASVMQDNKPHEHALQTGDLFCIEEKEIHRFKTIDQSMIVVPFHPDGDWGPTDHNHSMINRTYITNKK